MERFELAKHKFREHEQLDLVCSRRIERFRAVLALGGHTEDLCVLNARELRARLTIDAPNWWFLLVGNELRTGSSVLLVGG